MLGLNLSKNHRYNILSKSSAAKTWDLQISVLEAGDSTNAITLGYPRYYTQHHIGIPYKPRIRKMIGSKSPTFFLQFHVLY